MTPDHDVDSDFEHLYPPRKWGDPMGKPFDEERAPRMDATSRAAAEIDRLHTAEARVSILESQLESKAAALAEYSARTERTIAAQQQEIENLRTQNDELRAALTMANATIDELWPQYAPRDQQGELLP